MGGSQSREKALDRWLSQKKDLTALISSNGGLNSHLSIGLYQLAVSNQILGSESSLLTLSKSVEAQHPNNFIVAYFPALVLKQLKERPEYLECFVVIDQISTLIACRTSIKDGGCCMGVDQNFDLRISHLNLENVALTENNVVIKYSNDQKEPQQIELRLQDPSVVQKLKVAHAILHQNGPPPKWVYETVSHLIPPKDLQERGLSKQFLAHLLSGGSSNLDVWHVPGEWCATLPPMQHVHQVYYTPENKPNIGPPPPREATKCNPPAVKDYDILCRTQSHPSAYWSDVPFTDRQKMGFPTPCLPAVAEAVGGTLSLNHSSVGDPQEINVLKLHGSAYAQSIQRQPSLSPRPDPSRPGYPVISDCQIASGGLYWGSTPRSNPLPCNPRILSALLETLKFNSWCHVLEFGDCFIPSKVEDEILGLMADVCRCNTTMISLSFPPRAPSAPPVGPNTSQYQLWAKIGEALATNPNPLFSSLDFSNCHLGDDGIRAILPGLKRLFSMRNVISSLKFNNNNLSGLGVAMICDALLEGNFSAPFSSLSELSFGDNPWCGLPNQVPMQQLSVIIRLSPQLQKLNVGSSDGLFSIHLLANDLIGSCCPLSELVLGGSPLNQAGAYDFVRSVINIGTAKVNTLTLVSMRSIQIDNAGAVELINSLGSVKIDISDNGLGTMYQVFVSPQARLAGLNCARDPFYSALWWTTFPQYLRDLDFSNLQLTNCNHPDLFQPLTSALASSPFPLALESVNISFVVATPASVVRFLEVCLLCPMIQLKKLDISGCLLGDLVFHCLGHCLRRNRTLTSLKFDGQRASMDGWAAFRGCLYGNKKLLEVSYPYADAARFFLTADQIIADGYGQIPAFKQKIKGAYRSKNMSAARRHIDDMVAVKIKYKEWERAIGRTACVLQEIYTSVEQNAKEAAEIKIQKKFAKLQTPKVFEMKQKICIKKGKLLTKLVEVLEKLRKTTGERFSPSDDRTLLTKCTADWSSPRWGEVDKMIRMTSYLFIPRNFTRFVSLLGFIFTPTFPEKLEHCLTAIRVYLRDLEAKALRLWDQNLYELAGDIWNMASGPIAQYRGYQFVAPPPVMVNPPPVAKKLKKHRSRGDDDDDDDDNDDNDNWSRHSRDEEDRHHRDKDKDDDDKDNDNEVPEQDENGNDDNNNSDNENNDNDNNDNDGGNEGDDLENGLEDIGMYGGAGPQDLPDGGPDDDPNSSAARCSVKPYTLPKNQKSRDRPARAADYAALLDNCVERCPTLLLPLDYEMKMSYAVLSSSPSTCSTCTLITQCSIDRFPQLKSQILAWNSAVSVAIYVPSPEHLDCLSAIDSFLKELQTTLAVTHAQYHVVVSLLFGHECDSKKHLWDLATPEDRATTPFYPINNLRNLAVGAAESSVKSPLLFLVDVDFIPSVGLSHWIDSSKTSSSLVSRCDAGEMFVVPAFERDVDYEMNSEDMARSLIQGLDCGFVTPFHVSHFPAGHQPTNFERWTASLCPKSDPALAVEGDAEEDEETYPVAYKEYFEPYVIISRKKFLPYDERFRGYGMNKCIHLKAMQAGVGGSFHVIKKHYLIAAGHDRSVSHQLTYQPSSRFRRFVIAKLYQMASAEMLSSCTGPVSSLSKRSLDMFALLEQPVAAPVAIISPPNIPAPSSSIDSFLLSVKKVLSSFKEKNQNRPNPELFA